MIVAASVIESTIVTFVHWLKLGVETLGAGLVALGASVAIANLARAAFMQESLEFTASRLILARYLALALEFELGADILATAVSPSWDQIGKLGAIAVIRTGLNYFLSMEIRTEKVRGGEACIPKSNN